MAAVDAHDVTKTYDCKTPGCTGEAASKTGRHAYCLPCRVNRGTALPDGTPIETQSHVVSPRRKIEPLGPFEERALVVLDAARHLDLAVERYKLARPALDQAVTAWRGAIAAPDHSGRVEERRSRRRRDLGPLPSSAMPGLRLTPEKPPSRACIEGVARGRDADNS